MTEQVCLGVPLFLFVRLPKPLVPPMSDTDPAFPGHLTNLRRRLVKNTSSRRSPRCSPIACFRAP